MTSSGDRRRVEEFVDELKGLLSTSLVRNVTLAGRARRLVRALVEETSRAPGAPQNGPSILERWLDFNTASLRLLSEHALAFADGVIGAAERSLLAEAPVREPGSPAAAVTVELEAHGRLGERVTAPFLIENCYDRALSVSLAANDVVDPNGWKPLPPDALEFEPAHVELPARGQAVIQIAATLDDRFAPGTYVAQIGIRGFDAKTIRLVLRVEDAPPEASGEAPRAALARRRPRAR